MNPSDQEDSLAAEGETEVDDHENQTLEQGDSHVIIPNASRGRLDISDNWEELPSITPVKEWMKTGGHHQKEASCQKRLPQSIQNQEDSTNRGISNSPPPLVEMITVPFRHHRIRIFRKPAGSHQVMHRYFYDPVVQLDPQSVVSRENYVHFKILMWNEHVESKVIERLKELPDLCGGRAINVQVMDYYEVQLVQKDSATSTFRLPENSTVRYRQMDQHLDFSLLCNSKEEAEELVAQIRMEPSILTHQVALECWMLEAFKSANSDMHHPFTFDLKETERVQKSSNSEVIEGKQKGHKTQSLPIFIKVLPIFVFLVGLWCFSLHERIQSIEKKSRLLDNQAQLLITDLALRDFKVTLESVTATNKGIIPIFTISGLKEVSPNSYVSFHHQEADDSLNYNGQFNPITGLFTARSPGSYLFLFRALARDKTRLELRVNACVKASAMTTYSSHNKALVVSAIVQLKIGDEVGVFLRDGNLFDLWLRPAQFSGILLSS